MPYLLLHGKLLFVCFYVQGPCISEQLGKGFLEEKISKKKKTPNPNPTKTKQPCPPTPMAPPYQREEDHRLTNTEIVKSGHCKFAKSLDPKLTRSPREAMQDEDGYVTLNIKGRKPALTSGKSARSQQLGN